MRFHLNEVSVKEMDIGKKRGQKVANVISEVLKLIIRDEGPLIISQLISLLLRLIRILCLLAKGPVEDWD